MAPPINEHDYAMANKDECGRRWEDQTGQSSMEAERDHRDPKVFSPE